MKNRVKERAGTVWEEVKEMQEVQYKHEKGVSKKMRGEKKKEANT